jgi:IclR family acetate operon transcriptional repressor
MAPYGTLLDEGWFTNSPLQMSTTEKFTYVNDVQALKYYPVARTLSTDRHAAAAARPKDVPPVKSARRTVELLEFLAGEAQGCTLASVHQHLGHPKSSLYMLLRTLVGAGWVETDPTGTLYRVGLRALLVGTAYIDGSGLLAAARQTLEQLRDTTGETVHIAGLDGSDVVYLATYESRHYLRAFSRVGRRQPAYTTSLGKSLLADRPDGEVLDLLPARLTGQTPNSITSRSRLMHELVATRRRGYAIDREENTVGLMCVGMALHDSRPALHAVSCSVPVARLSPGRLDEIVASLGQACHRIDELAERLGL